MRRDLVVVGASAGGVEALRQLVSSLPKDLPAAVVVSYGDTLTLAQGKSPELLGPAGLDYDVLRKQALTVLGASSPDLAAQLAAISDWRTTLPVPV